MKTNCKILCSIRRSFIALMLILSATSSNAKIVEMSVPSFVDGIHKYYHELLIESIKENGYLPVVAISPGAKNIPQKRAIKMLEHDMLSTLWLVQSKARDEKYTPVEIGITNNLIGHRIMFIPKGTQVLFDNINTLEDFRKSGLTGGFGKNWFDVKVWNANNLKSYEMDGDWRRLYLMVAHRNRGIDYFSRGFNEIMIEAQTQPALDIEQRLMLIYDRDFRFYLSPSAAKYKQILEESLTKAKKSGLMDKLIRKHWSKSFSQLNFDKRIKIRLKTPM